MYRIEFKKEKSNNGLYLPIIKNLTIDLDDILMMKNIDILYNGNKYLVALYLKYLKHCCHKKRTIYELTIPNNNLENGYIINSIISTDWLINQDTINDNIDELEKRRELFQKTIEELRESPKIHDQHQILLMQYFIDTFDFLKQIDELCTLEKQMFSKRR